MEIQLGVQVERDFTPLITPFCLVESISELYMWWMEMSD